MILKLLFLGAAMIFWSSAFAQPLPLGEVVVTKDAVCKGGRCYEAGVTCPEVADSARVKLRVGGSGTQGTILFFTGGPGTSYWGATSSYASAAINDLRTTGYKTIEVAWIDGWLEGVSGQALLACRPATIAAWVRDNLHSAGAFCATGNSAGSSQVAYMLTHYGLAQDLAAVVLTGGPVFSDIAAGCLIDKQSYSYTLKGQRRVDSGFGFNNDDGPCVTKDVGWADVMRQASHNFSGSQYEYPDTMVWLMWGERDTGTAYGQGLAFLDRISDTPDIAVSIIPGTGHVIHNTAAGANAVRDALLLECKL